MFIYVIGSDDGPQKIGIARSPRNRLAQICVGSPFPIRVQDAIACGEETIARQIERDVHVTFAKNRMAGEWFAITATEAIREVHRAARAVLPNMPDGGYLPNMITPAQIRAARALIGWKQADLAGASGISEISIKNIERGATDPRSSTLSALQSAFLKAGVVFLDPGDTRDGGPGVRKSS